MLNAFGSGKIPVSVLLKPQLSMYVFKQYVAQLTSQVAKKVVVGLGVVPSV